MSRGGSFFMGIYTWAKKKAKKFAREISRFVRSAAEKTNKTEMDALKSAAGKGSRIVRNTLKGTLSAHVEFVQTVDGIFKDVVGKFQRDIFKKLLELGKSPLKIVWAVAELVGGHLGIIFANFIEIWGGRKLTAEEKREARKIFGRALPLGEIRIATSAPVKVIHRINGKRPFATLRLICYSSEEQLRKRGMQTFIHELTHVWQYEKDGPAYMVRSLCAQAMKGQKAYTVKETTLIEGNQKFKDFNPEQQATIVERFWLFRWGPKKNLKKAILYEPYAKNVYKK